MEIKILVLFAMIFCHIVDDYYLQGILAKLKQKKTWEEHDKKYKYDYIVALIMHSFSWAFLIMLPILLYCSWQIGWLLVAIPINTAIHAVVDDLKANKLKINLICDQTIHIVQIVITYLLWTLLIA